MAASGAWHARQAATPSGGGMVPNNSRIAPDTGGEAEAVTRAANVRDFEHDGRERRGLCREVRGAIGATFAACRCVCAR